MKSAKEKHMTGALTAAAVIVAHPDDEVLWAGGHILAHPDWAWFILALCRGSDPDRAARFAHAIHHLRTAGRIADLDDGPDQDPLPPDLLQRTILASLPAARFDHLYTHGPDGEYTRHRRHEEVCRAVVTLWQANKLTAGRLYMFAYEDGSRAYLPRPRADAHHRQDLSEDLWREKYRLITGVYGFAPDTWEARTTPRQEAFWCFDSPRAAARHVQQSEPTR